MAELRSHHTWVLELSTEELVLIADALMQKLGDLQILPAAKLGEILLSKRVSHSTETVRPARKKR